MATCCKDGHVYVFPYCAERSAEKGNLYWTPPSLNEDPHRADIRIKRKCKTDYIAYQQLSLFNKFE